MLEDRQVGGALVTQSMGNSEITTNCVEGYQTLFTALEDELLEVEHFFAEPKYNDVVDGVMSFGTFSLQKCINVTTSGVPSSNLLEGEKAKTEMFAGNLEQTTEGLSDEAKSLPDICDEYLLDPEDDDINTSHMENIDTSHHSAGAKNMLPSTSKACISKGESDMLTSVFKFRTKPRARNVKRGRAASYSYLKAFTSEVSKLVFGLSDMQEKDSLMTTKKRLRKPVKRFAEESSRYDMRNSRRNYDSFDTFLADGDCNIRVKTQKDNGVERRKKHHSWSIPEMLKLVEGVAVHGVGKWSVIKRLLFPTCAHRSSVNLKDKWRNLLRAANCKPARASGRGKTVLRNASPAMTQHILCRVRELAVIHPYPRPRCSMTHQTVSSSSSCSESDLSNFSDILPSLLAVDSATSLTTFERV